jgi:lysophospholipase L1-like esterase
MRRLALLVALLAAAPLVLMAPAQARSKGQMVVIGDSISDVDFYASRGNAAKTIWWKKISKAGHLSPYVYAERGSGYAVPGKCVGTTIDQRINRPAVTRRLQKASVVIVAAGVNDRHECNVTEGSSSKWQALTDEKLEAAIAQTMTDLDAVVEHNERVFITVPYGPRKDYRPYRARITRLLKTYSALHGFTYVKTDGGVLSGKRTKDGIHPNAKGSQALYRHIYEQTVLKKRFPH